MTNFLAKRIKNVSKSIKSFTKHTLKIKTILDCKIFKKHKTEFTAYYPTDVIRTNAFQNVFFPDDNNTEKLMDDSLNDEILRELENLDLILKQNE